MAYMNTTTTHRGTAFDRIGGFFAAVAKRLRERRIYRETYEGLNALSNRDLNDLGLTRSELHAVAKTSARNAVA